MSGIRKTKFGVFLREINPNLLHIDTDSVRSFFELVGYDGENLYIFQKSASKAIENIELLLDRDYKIEICYEYAIKGEVVTKRKVPDVYL